MMLYYSFFCPFDGIGFFFFNIIYLKFNFKANLDLPAAVFANFIEFLLDFTDKKKASILSKLVFKTLMKKSKNDIFNIIPKSAKFRLNINEQTLP